MNPRLLIIVPAYNEAENILRVKDELHQVCPQYDYVVVNDGSGDETAAICRSNGIPLLDLPVNLGLAGAFTTGMRYAQRKGYDYAIQIDGDGQHDPAYIEKLLFSARETHSDIVIGSRFLQGDNPHSLRRAGSRVIEWVVRLTTGKKLTDPTSGMRMYSRRMIDFFASHGDFGPEPDTLAFLMRCGAKVSEIPVRMRERMAGKSYLNFSRAASYMVQMGMSIMIFQWFRRKIQPEEENASCP